MKKNGASSYHLIGLLCAFALGAPGCDYSEKVTPSPTTVPQGGQADLGVNLPDGGVPDAAQSDGGGVVPDGAVAGPDLAPPPPPYKTPFPPVPPQVLPGSGTVLSSPTVVPVFFPRDPLQAGVLTFLRAYLGTSTSWQVVQQYGVGRGTVATPVVLSTTNGNSLSDADVQALVALYVQNGTLPRPGAGTVYGLFFPSGVTINFNSQVSCTDFSGYHQTAQLADGTRYTYVVLPRCNTRSLAALTSTASHELAESSTDPALTGNLQLAAPYGLWQFALHGAEIGDLCQNLSDFTFTESGVGVVSRLWGNSAAKMNGNPCQPAPAGPVFFSVPILTELRQVSLNGVLQDAESVPVMAGQSATIEVRLLSPSRPSPTWSVTAQEVPLPSGKAALSLSWMEPRASGTDGTTLHLQIAAAAGASPGYTTVLLTSTGPTASGGQTQTQWVAAVRIF